MMSTESASPLVVNTNSFCEEDLTTFLECSERIQRCEQRQRHEWKTKAVKTHEEVFETNAITDDDLIKRSEGDLSFVSYSASMEDLLKYFEEDVEVDSDPPRTAYNTGVPVSSSNGEVVVEKSIKPSEVKQREMKPANVRRDEEVKREVVENIIKNYGAKRNTTRCSDNRISDLKPNVKVPLSEVKSSDLQFIHVEPSPNASGLKVRAPTPSHRVKPEDRRESICSGSLKIRELRRKFFNLNDLDDLEDKQNNFDILNSSKSKDSESQSNDQRSDFKIPHGVKPYDTSAKPGYLKPNDLNLTRNEWEARYLQIIQNDLKPTKVPRSDVKPRDLNMTQKQWEDRYFKIIQDDLIPAISKPKRPQMPVKLYESQDHDKHQSKWDKPLKPKGGIKSKVQKMAEMFNGIISQVMNREPSVSTYDRLKNELSPEAVKPPLPKARTMTPIPWENSPIPSPRPRKLRAQETGCLIPEEVFTKLSVKDKVLLYNKFMREMHRRNPDFSPNTYKIETLELNTTPPGKGEVASEKQETVKSLAKELESRMTFPKLTISESALPKPSKKRPAPQPPSQQQKKDDSDSVHVSSLTIVLKPSPGKADSEVRSKLGGTPRLRRKVTSPTVVLCPTKKRSNHQICSSVPIDVYAPPRKIRRTRPERSNPKKFFQTPHLERLFYVWMKERHGLSFDIHASEPSYPATVVEREEKTNETDTTLKNEEETIPTKEVVKPSHPVFKSDPSESDSSLMTMPSSKVPTDESQTDHPKESPAEFEFVKPIRPPRKKKVKRATLTWKKDASIVEKLPVSTTDSDSDYKQLELQQQQQQQQQKAKKPMSLPTGPADQSKGKQLVFKEPPVVPPQSGQNSFDADEAFLDFMNSPRRVRNAYTLTVMTSPSQNTESPSSMISEEPPAKPPRKAKPSSSPQLPYAIDESKFENEDQGFETESNEFSPIRLSKRPSAMKSPSLEKSPLFIKLNADLERRRSEGSQTPSAYSTPVKENLNNTRNKTTPVKKSSWHTVFSPIPANLSRRKSLADPESRRSSILMDVIREEHNDQQTQLMESPDLEDEVFLSSSPSTDLGTDDKSSSFWISIGDLTVSLKILENPSDRLSLLYEIFSQKSGESRDTRFGIDDFKYSPKDGTTKEAITKNLPKIDGVSHYWFASGDLAIPFQGNYMSPEAINRTFTFVRDSSADGSQLTFGVDDFEFSKIPSSITPKFSIESSYSMLIGLNEDHRRSNKFPWPNTSRNSTPLKTSDFDPSEFDSDAFEPSEVGRLSFSPYGSNYFDMVSMRSGERTSVTSFGSMGSPEMFSFEYENEPLDKMFGKRKENVPVAASETYLIGKCDKPMPKQLPPTESMTVEKMIDTIRQQQAKLHNIENEMKTYTNPASFTSSVLDKYKGRPYVKKLQNIVKSIQIIGKSGFQNCTAQQLESFLYFLSLYAETCLSTCSDNMHKIMDKLMDEKAVEPPENELQKSHDNTTRLSEHQLRVQASLQRLNIPDWFRQYNHCLQKSPEALGGGKPGNSNFTRKRTSDSGRWTGLNSKTTSLSSLGSQRSDRSPLLLSPSAHSHHGGQTTIGSVASSTGGANVSGGFSRWSTSYLNSTQTSPSVSTRGSFSRGGPVNSSFISATGSTAGTRNSFRQPYLGWRSQEKLSQPRTPHERLASSLLSQRPPKPEPVTPEIQTSIKEVTSAIVHYVNDQTNRTNQRSRSASPNSRKCWLESSFVGIRPVESPQTPIIDNSTFSNTSTGGLNHSYHNNTPSATSSIHSSIGINNVTTADGLRINGVGAPERTMSSASLEDVLASLLGLPTTQVPATNDTYRSTGDTASEAVNLRMTSSTSPSSLQVVDQQARFRRRSEGDAQRQQQQQQQLQQQQKLQQQQSQNQQIACTQKPPPTVNNYHPETVQTPRRVSLDSSESKTTSELQIKCRNTKCDQAATPVDAKKFYKSCHNCSHLYCSRECRRAHWEKHRKACLHSRASNLCRQVLSACKDDVDTQRHLSLLARKGYLSQGRGVVRALFRSAESAEGFIKHGFQCMGEASYVRWPDLMPAEMGLELYSELLKLSTEYKPDSKMLIYVAICVVSEAPGTATAPVKWERQLVSRCAKLKLCKSILTELEQSQQQIVVVPEPATEILILTFNPAKRSTPSQREVILTNILTILNRRGVILRKHYPEIYQRLQTYAEGQTDRFNAVTLHPRDSQTGQGFVCIIMPLQSDSEIIKMPCSDGGNKVSTIDVGEELMES